MRNILLTCAVLALSACAQEPVTPFDISGSKAAGTITMGGTINSIQEIEWDAGDEIALRKCQSWGYSGVEAFAGTRQRCLVMSGGLFSSCQSWEVTRDYQCTG